MSLWITIPFCFLTGLATFLMALAASSATGTSTTFAYVMGTTSAIVITILLTTKIIHDHRTRRR